MLFFLVLHDVTMPDTGVPIVTAGELLTYAQLWARFNGDFMDNLITHVISAPDRAEALKIVAVLAVLADQA